MPRIPLKLMQILGIGGFTTQLSTDASITKRELRRFFHDVSEILKELDPEINYEGELYKWGPSGLLEIPSVYTRVEKSLQVRTDLDAPFSIENVVRTNNIIYKKNPSGLSEDLMQIAQDNMYGDVIMVVPNLSIHSSSPQYGTQDFVQRLIALPYVDFADDYNSHVFNPDEVTATLTDPRKHLTSTGRVLTVYDQKED